MSAKKTILHRLLELGWRYRAGCVKTIGLQFVILCVGVVGLWLTGLGIDYISWRVLPSGKSPVWPFGFAPPKSWSDFAVIALIAGSIAFIGLIRSWLSYHYSVVLVKLLQQGIVVDLRSAVYDKLQRLSFRFYDSSTTGTLINRVTGDVQSVRLFIDGVMVQGAILIFSLIVYLLYMLSINVKLTLACLATTPLMWIASVIFARKVKPAYHKDRELVDKMILDLGERAQGVHVVKGFAREPEELEVLAADNRAVMEQKRRIFTSVCLYSPGMEMLSQINLAILLAYGGYMVTQGTLQLGSGLVVFLGLLQRFSAQISSMTGVTDSIQQSLAAAGRVFEVLDAPIEIKSGAEPQRLPSPKGGVRFAGVGFDYTPGERTLEDISFEATPGQFVGVIGATGSGKSTLLSLIPRFYDATKGSVLVDGVDVRELSLEDLRRCVGMVFQDSFLFSNTIAANIAFGHPEATMDRIERAAKIAAAHDFILRLPQGYQTVIGESGMDLSGGQRQRLAIARAILLNPPILLLDDPTAAVDAGTETEIMEALDEAMKGRTTFFVTHRINAVRHADLILVLHGGKIVQRGVHDDLIRVKGRYRRTAGIQYEESTLPTPFDPSASQVFEK